jgi:ribosomal protein S18 acetylase RimI-like enzyme
MNLLSKKYKYILLIIITLIVFYILLYYDKYVSQHEFWNYQSVSKSILNIDNKKINNTPNIIKINLPIYKIDITDNTNIIELVDFLKNNYIKNNNIDFKYLKWYFNYPAKYFFVYGIKNKQGRIIGCISGYSIILHLNGNNIKTLYVDLLCVDKNERNRKIAPQLITKMMKTYKNIKYDTCIFAKDNKPLPFNYISCLQWNFIPFEKSIKKIKENIKVNKKIYLLYVNYFLKSNHKIYRKYTYEEFRHYFQNVKIYFDENKKSLAFYTTHDNIIQLIFCINFDLNKFSNIGYDGVYFLNNLENNLINVKKTFFNFNFLKSYKNNKKNINNIYDNIQRQNYMFYHLYNYKTPIINKEDFGFFAI